jgi:hypothetical protein
MDVRAKTDKKIINNPKLHISSILKAPSTTPIEEPQCELGLTSIENGRIWLSGRFIIRIDKQTQHPLNPNCYNMRRSPKLWK